MGCTFALPFAVDVTPFWQRHLCALAVHDGEYSAKKTGKVEWSTHKQLHLIASPPLTYAGGLAQGRVLGRDLLFPSDLAALVAESDCEMAIGEEECVW